MSVEKGTDWGERAQPPSDLVVVDDSAEAVEVIAAQRRANRPLPSVGIRGGDLVRTLGGPTTPDLRTADEALQVSIDLGAVLVDGDSVEWFSADISALAPCLELRAIQINPNERFIALSALDT